MKRNIWFCMFLIILLCFSAALSCSKESAENGTEQEEVDDSQDLEQPDDLTEQQEEEEIDHDDSSKDEEEKDSDEDQEEGPVLSDEQIIQRVIEIENLETELFDEKNITTDSDYQIKHKTIQNREQLRKYFENGYSIEVAELMAFYYMDDEGYLIPGESTKVVEYAQEVVVVEKTPSKARVKAVMEMFGITNTHYINLEKIQGTWKIVD